MGSWFTVGAKKLLRDSGRFYYEVKLFSDMYFPQLGWLNEEFQEEKGDDNHGVGDDEYGWATDGLRHKFWHGGSQMDAAWPRTWKGGDVIGLAVDIDAGNMRFSLNGEWVDS